MAKGTTISTSMGARGQDRRRARAQRSKLFCCATRTARRAREPIAGGVCYCCKTALAAGADGADLRGVAARVSRGTSATSRSRCPLTVAAPSRRPSPCQRGQLGARRLSRERPVAGGGRHDRVHVVVADPAAGGRFDERADAGAVLRDVGRRPDVHASGTHSHRRRARHPQVALGSRNELFIVWDEQDGGTRRVAAARAEARRVRSGDVRAAAIGGHRASRISGRGQRQRRGGRRVDQRVRRVEHDQADARGPLARQTAQPITSIVNPPGAVK